MIRYVLKRLVMMIPVLLGVSFLIFTMLYFSPGDPAVQILGEGASEEAILELREELGLNDPFFVRYFNYLKDMILYQDWGTSYSLNASVFTTVVERFPTTLALAALSIAVATCIGVLCGIIAAVKQYSVFDYVATICSLIGAAMPNFWQGMMMILLFSVWLGWLPPSGIETPLHWIMPALTIGTSTSAGIMRMTRSSMLEVIRQDYIRTARAKGVSGVRIIFGHALKNSLIPVITYFGPMLAYIVTGSLVVEKIFAVPGIGRAFVNSITNRDYPLIMGTTIVLATLIVVMNLVSDILYKVVDPRITLE